MKTWLCGRPIDSNFWLLRAARSLITLFSLVFGFFMLFILMATIFEYFENGSSDTWSVSLIAMISCVIGVAFGQLCHALADIASQLSRLDNTKF